MAIATFGISNNGLNLVVNLLILMLVGVWLALIVYTYLDARRRISDPFLIGCATLASFIPYIGTAVYAIVRPPEFLEDAHERELEIKAAELRVRQLTEHSCPDCGFPIEKNFLRCPECRRRLKNPCPSCSRPVDPKWALCPYCETVLGKGERPRRRKAPARKKAPTAAASGEQKEQPKEPVKSKRPQRSPSREPDPDPRQA
jgi:Double zinc ribbon